MVRANAPRYRCVVPPERRRSPAARQAIPPQRARAPADRSSAHEALFEKLRSRRRRCECAHTSPCSNTGVRALSPAPRSRRSNRAHACCKLGNGDHRRADPSTTMPHRTKSGSEGEAPAESITRTRVGSSELLVDRHGLLAELEPRGLVRRGKSGPIPGELLRPGPPVTHASVTQALTRSSRSKCLRGATARKSPRSASASDCSARSSAPCDRALDLTPPCFVPRDP